MPPQFRSRGSGKNRKVYPVTLKGLYSAPRYKKYSEMLSGIHTEKQANDAGHCMLKEFNEAGNRGTQIRIKRALVERANRAFVAKQDGIGLQLQFFYMKMDVPPKGGTGVVVNKTKWGYQVATWQNGKLITKTHHNLTKAQAQKHAAGEREAIAKGYYGEQKDGKALVAKSTLAKEKAAVKDELQGIKDYDKLAMLAEDEGRLEDAKVFRQHAKDEARHPKNS